MSADVADLTKYGKGDIIKISSDNSTTLGRVVDSTETDVLVFRLPENIWYSLTDYKVELLEVAH